MTGERISQGVTSYYRSSDGPEVQVFEIQDVFANPNNEYKIGQWILDFEYQLKSYMRDENENGNVYLAVIDVSKVRYAAQYNYNVVNLIIDRIDSLPTIPPGYRIGFFYNSPGLSTLEYADDYQPTSDLGKLGKLLLQGLGTVSAIVEAGKLKSDPANDWVGVFLDMEKALNWVRASAGSGGSKPLLPRM